MVLTCRFEKGAKFADIVAAMKEAAAGDVNGALDWTDEEVVSTDFVSCKSSPIFDVSASSALTDNLVTSGSQLTLQIAYGPQPSRAVCATVLTCLFRVGNVFTSLDGDGDGLLSKSEMETTSDTTTGNPSPSGMPMTMTKEAPFGASLGLSDGKSQQPFGWHARRD